MAANHGPMFSDAMDSSSSSPPGAVDQQAKTAVIDSSWKTQSCKRPRQSHDADNSQQKQHHVVESTNRFAPLSTLEEEERADKPPPIYVKGVLHSDYKILLTQLKSIGKDNFECQATNNNGVTIYPKTSDVYRAFIHYLKNANASYHTYQLPQEKAFRVVIRHLHPSTDPVEVTEALTALSYSVRNVVNVLQSGTRIPLPLFFVDLEPKKDNNRIFELKSLLHARISVEEQRVKRDIIQCKRCLQFGHSRTYCNHSTKCARCGESHSTSACELEQSVPRKCALCQGSHSTTYRGCQVYKELRDKRFNTNIIAKANKHIVNSKTTSMERPASPVAFSVPQASRAQQRHQRRGGQAYPPLVQRGAAGGRLTQHTEQVNTHAHIQHAPHDRPAPAEERPPAPSPRDPRLTSRTYAGAVSSQSQHTQVHARTTQYPPPTQQGAQDDINATLNTFFTRFQDLITPLLSTLTLLVNKLLASHG